MQVDVWSDVVCPWCYLGRRRLQLAIERFEHRDAVEVEWHSFQLQPDAPRFGEPGAGAPVAEYLATRGFAPAQLEEMQARLAGLAAAEGLPYRPDLAHHVNSFAAHTLVHSAARHGLGDAMVGLLFKAQHADDLRIDDPATLPGLAAEVGLEWDPAQPDQADVDAVHADIDEARQLGVSGVPFFVFDRRLAVSGAQPTDLLLEALEQAFTADSAPASSSNS
ncbi:MAG TPA: DsbA family oxidoreductase [Solirubrobacterales bacterium]